MTFHRPAASPLANPSVVAAAEGQVHRHRKLIAAMEGYGIRHAQGQDDFPQGRPSGLQQSMYAVQRRHEQDAGAELTPSKIEGFRSDDMQ